MLVFCVPFVFAFLSTSMPSLSSPSLPFSLASPFFVLPSQSRSKPPGPTTSRTIHYPDATLHPPRHGHPRRSSSDGGGCVFDLLSYTKDDERSPADHGMHEKRTEELYFGAGVFQVKKLRSTPYVFSQPASFSPLDASTAPTSPL